jgi:hypothetical protein
MEQTHELLNAAAVVALGAALARIIEAQHIHSLFHTLRDSDSVPLSMFMHSRLALRWRKKQVATGKMLFCEMQAVLCKLK